MTTMLNHKKNVAGTVKIFKQDPSTCCTGSKVCLTRLDKELITNVIKVNVKKIRD